MKKFIYPAVFRHNDDDSYTIQFPDLKGCISEGKSLTNALFMAQDALAQFIEVLLEEKITLPKSTSLSEIKTEDNEFVNLITCQIKENRAVKRTISLPKWMDDRASAENISLSKVLQDALTKRFLEI